MGGLFAGIGRVLAPWAARAWTATTWSAIGWTLSDITNFFEAPEPTPVAGAYQDFPLSYATQKVVGVVAIGAVLVGWLLLPKLLRKRK